MTHVSEAQEHGGGAEPAPGAQRHLARLVDALIVIIGIAVLVTTLGGPTTGAPRAVVVVAALACTAAVLAVTLLNARDALGGRTRLPRWLRLVLQAAVAYAPAPLLGLDWMEWAAAFGAFALSLLPRRAGLALFGAGLLAQVAVHAVVEREVAAVLYAALSYAASAFLLHAAVRAVAVSTELARARAELARTEVLRERLRMSRDLHDLLGRSVAAVSLKTELALRYQRRGAVDRAEAELEQVLALSHQAGADLRALVSGYRALSLETELSTGAKLLRDAGIRCEARMAEHPLPARVDETAAWVVRESLTNVLKHAAATTCSITGEVTGEGADRALRLTIANDGALPPEGGARSGTGLVGVLERVEALGGSASATRSPDGTFSLVVVAPLEAAARPGVSRTGPVQRGARRGERATRETRDIA